MNVLDAIVLGILEGLTEFLPVSSTGHLILVSGWLGQGGSEASKTLDVVIQLGAVLAVVVYFRKTLAELVVGFFRRDPKRVRLVLALVVGFIPAAVIGLALHTIIKAHLL